MAKDDRVCSFRLDADVYEALSKFKEGKKRHERIKNFVNDALRAKLELPDPDDRIGMLEKKVDHLERRIDAAIYERKIGW